MKKNIFLLLLTIFLISIINCSNERNTMNTATEKIMKLPNKAKTYSDMNEIKIKVNEYFTTNMQYPKTLEDLNLNLYYPLDNYKYDDKSGSVKSKYYK